MFPGVPWQTHIACQSCSSAITENVKVLACNNKKNGNHRRMAMSTNRKYRNKSNNGDINKILADLANNNVCVQVLVLEWRTQDTSLRNGWALEPLGPLGGPAHSPLGPLSFVL